MASRILDGSPLRLALPNDVHRDRCQEVRSAIDEALAQQFSQPVAFELVVDTETTQPDFLNQTAPEPEPVVEEPGDYESQDWIDPSQLEDAPDTAVSGVDQVLDVFEGSTVIEPPPHTEGYE